MINLWIGDNYSRLRILVLGESWYGQLEPLSDYLNRWSAKELNDTTFSRIYKACTGENASRSSIEQRKTYWNGVAFYNFIVDSVGPSRCDRPNTTHFSAAQEPFRKILSISNPLGVWVLGKGQSKYSIPIIESCNITFEAVAHPTSYGLKTEKLRSSWLSLIDKIGIKQDRLR